MAVKKQARIPHPWALVSGAFAGGVPRVRSIFSVVALLTVLALVVGLVPFGARAQDSGGRPNAPVQTEAGVRGPSVILTRSGVDPDAVAADNGIQSTFVYRNVTTGFAADLTDADVSSLQNDANVISIAIDRPLTAAAYSHQITRVGADTNPATGIGSGGGVNVGIAILDSGVNSIGRINVAGGTDCTSSGAGYQDQFGHGTEVASLAAASDVGSGVVGIAPGARVYAVKVLDANGNGSFSQAICGLDWVAAHSDEINVVNLSLTGFGSDGQCSSNTFHQAICETTAMGIPVVAAAGNYGIDTSNVVPATWNEVVAVSSFSDTDGRTGGMGPSCAVGGYSDPDDTFSSFSDYGADDDIMAPGGCIQALGGGGGTVTVSGTSFAAPLVSGALATFGSLSAISVPQSDPRAAVRGAKSGEPVLYVGTSRTATATATARPARSTSTPTSTPRSSRSTSTPTRAVVSNSLGAQGVSTATPLPARSTSTRVPTDVPTETPTREPTVEPTSAPTETPTPEATEIPTDVPTETPTDVPTEEATETPTYIPTDIPTEAPTDIPTQAPTEVPTEVPAETPTIAPVLIRDSVDSQTTWYVADDDETTSWYMDVPSIGASPASPEVADVGDPAVDDGPSLVIDLGESQQVDAVRYQWAETTYAHGVEIQVSDDGVNWTTVAWPDTFNEVPGEWQSAPVGTSARYVRFLFPDPDQIGTVGGLTEVEVMPVADSTS